MKYSKYDLILVAIVIFQLAIQILWAFQWEELSFGQNIIIFFFCSVLFYYNPIVVTHNFLHTPFFKSTRLNKIFSIFNSAVMTLPQSIYRYHHMNHHRHNNSLKDPSSTLIYGKNGKQEHWIPYCSFSLFRDGTQVAYKQILAAGEGPLLLMQTISLLMILIIYGLISWKWLLFIYFPLFYVGFFLAHLENYFEHYKAKDFDNRYANSVSYYPRWYNILMFNEGFHQEHHIAPQTHWSERNKTKEKYLDKMQNNHAYQASHPPLLGFFD